MIGEWLGRLAKYLVVVLLAAYLLDWAVYAVQRVSGHGTAVVQVDDFVATPLKGNKVEYDYTGTDQVTCAESLFPHSRYPVCWWVRTHKDQWVR